MPLPRVSAARVKLAAPLAALFALLLASTGLDVIASLVRKRVMRVKRGGIPVEVKAVNQKGSETLVSLGSSSLTGHPGMVVLWSKDKSHFALLGPVYKSEEGTVVRHVQGNLPVEMTNIQSGFLYGHVGQTPADFDLEFNDVEVNKRAAWLVPAIGGNVNPQNWAIHVHGLGGGRNQTLRGLPVFAQAGFTSLVPSFEISLDQGVDHQRSGSFGVQEIDSLVAAHDFAVSRGATSIIFVGWSYGALAVVRALALNRWEEVAGNVFVSPALEWKQIVQNGLGRIPIPAVARSLLLARFNSRISRKSVGKVNWAGIGTDVNLALAEWPTLITHGDSDEVVPHQLSVALEKKYDATVTTQIFSGAHHGMEWNSAKTVWESVVADWIEAL